LKPPKVVLDPVFRVPLVASKSYRGVELRGGLKVQALEYRDTAGHSAVGAFYPMEITPAVRPARRLAPRRTARVRRARGRRSAVGRPGEDEPDLAGLSEGGA